MLSKKILWVLTFLVSIKSSFGAVDLTQTGILKSGKGIVGAIAGFNLMWFVWVMLIIAFIVVIFFFIMMTQFWYKHPVWLFEDKGLQTTIFKDRGRLIKRDNNRWIKLLWTKQETLFPTVTYNVGRKQIIFLYRTGTGDLTPITFFGKAPDQEWLQNNEVITIDKGEVDFDTSKIFPMIRPDNLKVRQIHTLLQREAFSRFTKKALWLEALPYFMTLGTVLLCFMMVIITLNTVGKIG